MSAQISPQPVAVGEIFKPETTTSKEVVKPSYASISQANQTASSKIELCAINFESEHPVIQFTMEDVNIFTREEGLYQAVVIKFSYGKPDVSEVRRIFSLQFDIKGHYNVGQLEYRHILVRFDLFDDYARFLGKSTGYLKSKSEEFFFRTFPWTFGFNPKEETPMAVVWISMPDLPPNLFARRSLLSIASAVGKPIAVDKATQDKTRPSAARVKVILNMLDKHPKKVLLQFIDSKSGKSVEFHQIIVYDNLPSYCNFCKHQGHVERACRYKDATDENNLATNTNGSGNIIEKLKGDARDFLNGKRAVQTKVVNNNQQANLVWKQKGEPKKVQSVGTESLTVDPVLKEGNETEVPITVSEDGRNLSNLEGDASVYLNANKVDCRPNVQHVGQSKALPSANQTGISTANIKVTAEKETGDRTGTGIFSENCMQDNYVSVSARSGEGRNVIVNDEQNEQTVPAEESATEQTCRNANSLSTHSEQTPNGNVEPTQNDAYDPLVVTAGVSDSSRKIHDNASLKLMCMADFEKSISNSTHEKGSVSGVKDVIAQQNLVDSGDLDASAEQIADTSLEGSRDTADLSGDKKNQIVEDREDSTEMHATVPSTLTAADNADLDQYPAQIGETRIAQHSDNSDPTQLQKEGLKYPECYRMDPNIANQQILVNKDTEIAVLEDSILEYPTDNMDNSKITIKARSYEDCTGKIQSSTATTSNEAQIEQCNRHKQVMTNAPSPKCVRSRSGDIGAHHNNLPSSMIDSERIVSNIIVTESMQTKVSRHPKDGQIVGLTGHQCNANEQHQGQTTGIEGHQYTANVLLETRSRTNVC